MLIEIEYSSNKYRNFKIHKENSNRHFYFRKADFPTMYGLFQNADWSDMMQCVDVETA